MKCKLFFVVYLDKELAMKNLEFFSQKHSWQD